MTMQQISYLFLCLFITVLLNTTCMEHPKEFNPQNTKFAFDFHEVIVTEPFASLSDCKKFFRWDMIPILNRYLPHCIYELLVCFLYEPTSEKLKNICLKYKQEKLISCIMDIGNSFVPIDGTIHIMKELKKEGYELDLASNINVLFLNELQKNDKYSDIQRTLALFTNKKAVDQLAIYSNTSICKPNILYFTAYQKEYNTDEKQVIFIDDRLKNIKAAETTGMIGIHFQNPTQLRDELVTRGILQ